MSALQALYGISVTLSDTLPHNLLVLLQGIDSSLNNIMQNCSSLAIQADTSNGSNAVYIGDSNVSTIRYGYALLTHDQVPYRSPINTNIPLSAIWVLAQAATCILNVEIWFV